MDKERKNCSTIFLLPGIGHTRSELLPYGFISAYLDDIHHEIHYEEALYLLFQPEDVKAFQEFLEKEELSAKNVILEDYDYEGGFSVVVYKFKEEYKSEFENFLQGKYSAFRENYTSLFPFEIWVEDKDTGIELPRYSLQYHIFTKSDAIRKYWEKKIGEKLPEEAELWSAPDMSKEVLDIESFY